MPRKCIEAIDKPDMSSSSSVSMDLLVVPDARLIQEVVEACGCREDMALTLLQVSPAKSFADSQLLPTRVEAHHRIALQ